MANLAIEKEGPVAVMVWRHETQNRFTLDFNQEIFAALDELAADREVRGVVITSGVEKFFSNGLHLEWMMQTAMADKGKVLEFLKSLNTFMLKVTAFPKPMIAAINGHATGMGAIITLCMDYRFMQGDRGFLRLPEIEINIPFLPGMVAIFHEVTPPPAFRDMTYNPQKYTADMAKACGFVDRVCSAEELRPAAVETAKKLGSYKLSTFAAIKQGARAKAFEIMKNDDPAAIEKMWGEMNKSFGGA
jgi:enoyl-CoA hydratase